MQCVVAAHLSEIAVSAPNGPCVAEMPGKCEFQPRHAVEHHAFEEMTAGGGHRQILVHHQQIVAEVKICLARV